MSRHDEIVELASENEDVGEVWKETFVVYYRNDFMRRVAPGIQWHFATLGLYRREPIKIIVHLRTGGSTEWGVRQGTIVGRRSKRNTLRSKFAIIYRRGFISRVASVLHWHVAMWALYRREPITLSVQSCTRPAERSRIQGLANHEFVGQVQDLVLTPYSSSIGSHGSGS